MTHTPFGTQPDPRKGKPNLQSLLERVQSATRPDRELDGLIGWHTDGWNTPICPEPQHVPYMIEHNGLPVPFYTASIDAALALTERVLPDANCIGIELERGQWCGYVSRNGVKEGRWFKEAYSTTPALALLASLLSALIAKEQP